MPLANHRLIGLDSNVIAYLVDDHPIFGAASAAVIDAIERGDVDGVMASLAIAEVLAGPARIGDAPAFERTADALRGLRIRVVDLDAELAADAAWLHGSIGGQAADAIHLATARRSGATAFVTNDRRIRSIPRLEVVYLEEVA